MDIRRIYQDVHAQVVGREEETQLILAALGAGRDLLLEGPPGTSKSTLLRAIAAAGATPLHFVEGNADLTPAKLVGHHSPARVLKEDYTPENFVYGPLPLAMRDGGLLYLEEFNRIPEDTLNTLITAMAERELTVPRTGLIEAADGFRVIAAMNPFDNIGTGRLSGAVVDRLCRVRMTYQPEAEERDIVSLRTGSNDGWLLRLAVRAVRRTREHPEIRMGASVRAAIDFVLVAEQLATLRAVMLRSARTDTSARRTLVAAAQTALSIKIVVPESSRRTPDELIEEVVLAALADLPDDDSPPPDGDGRHSAADMLFGDATEGQEAAPESSAANGRPPGASTGNVQASGTPSGGRVYSGEEARRAASSRQSGQRMLRTVLREHPSLEQLVRRDDLTPEALDAALRDEPGNPFDLLGELADLYDHRELRLLARVLARQLLVRTARHSIGARSGRGRLTSVPYTGEATELDIERSLDTLAANPWPADDDLWVLERRHRRRAYALMLDISGSMKGSAIFHAALALAAFAIQAGQDPFAVVAFWRDAAIVKALNESVPLDTLIDRVLSLSGHGLTNLGLGLRVGLDELAAAETQERIGLLFSDGLQTMGEPAEVLAAAYPTLHVVATGQSPESLKRCQRLATLGNGRSAAIEGIASIPRAISQCMAA